MKQYLDNTIADTGRFSAVRQDRQPRSITDQSSKEVLRNKSCLLSFFLETEYFSIQNVNIYFLSNIPSDKIIADNTKWSIFPGIIEQYQSRRIGQHNSRITITKEAHRILVFLKQEGFSRDIQPQLSIHLGAEGTIKFLEEACKRLGAFKAMFCLGAQY